MEQCNTGSGATDQFAAFYATLAAARAQRDQAHKDGPPALGRLLKTAVDGGFERDAETQARAVAGFLLSCYNGRRFKFDLTDFRVVDFNVFQDCMTVLRMDYSPMQEVHCYFKNGGAIFEKLAKDWDVRDYTKRAQ